MSIEEVEIFISIHLYFLDDFWCV